MKHALPRLVFALAALVLAGSMLSGCGKFSVFSGESSGGSASGGTAAPSGTYRPYTINGVTYVPLQSADGFREEGLASWYGRDFHGRRTSNGETYDMYAMTGAHKLLPMGTIVRVTRLDTGRSVDVRINDRGPFVRERVVDLSYAAAEELDIVRAGTARVRVEAVGGPPGHAPPTNANMAGTFYIQVGSFTQQVNASNLMENLRRRGYAATRLQTAVIGGKMFWRVQAGSFPGLNAARTAQAQLENEFPSCFVIAD